MTVVGYMVRVRVSGMRGREIMGGSEGGCVGMHTCIIIV